MKLKNKILLWSIFSALSGCIDDGGSSSKANDLGWSITVTSEVVDGEDLNNAYVYIYNQDQKLTLVTYDKGLDGQLDREEIYKYNEDGRYQSRSIFVRENGERYLKELVDYEYFSEDDHNIINSYDDNLDGTFDRVITRVYADNYRFIEIRYDDNADGVVDRVDEWGMPALDVERDIEYYNNIAKSSTTYYNANGDWIGESWDNDGDGTADSVVDIGYYSNGLKESESWDENADCTYERVTTYEYDDQKKLTREVFSNTDDPVTAYERAKVYEYENNQLSKITRFTLFGDREIQNFNESGHIVSFIKEEEGAVEEKYSYVYSGNLSLLENWHIPTYLYWN